MSPLGRACGVVLGMVILGGGAFSQTPFSLDELGIAVTRPSREFCFTNKNSAFYYGETNGALRSSWQGLNVRGIECLDDFRLEVDGARLDPSQASIVYVFPDRVKREYPDGTRETLSLTDSLSILSVSLTLPRPGRVSLIPLFADGRSSDDFSLVFHNNLVLIGRRRGAGAQVSGLWLAVSLTGGVPRRQDTRDRSRYSPVVIEDSSTSTHVMAFAVDDDAERASELARTYPVMATVYERNRRERMERVLAQSAVRTSDKRFDLALAWAILSLDALLMNQGGKGIFAGLPWFNNYWGRDTFVALPGATFVTGRFEEARSILRSFAQLQQTDSTSTDDGRIPNFVGPSGTAYNTADGTPRFASMTVEYVERSGDTAFGREMYPVIRRSIEGTLRYHLDTLAFLTHADAESWMDAAGADGPWSPRGNRANDVQALWIAQLEAGAKLAKLVGDTSSERRWQRVEETVRGAFLRHFVRGGIIIDHLNADGSPDGQLRPNQIFTAPILPPILREKMVKTVLSRLTYSYGVASLSQEDENFHPYHVNPPFYPKDAAYHNGTVWTWLQGSLVSELCRLKKQETAWVLTQSSVHQILDRGAVGTQSELLDALPRPGSQEPELSGTFSQAWSLAEFVRNFYEDYLGASFSRLDGRLRLSPSLPKGADSLAAMIGLGGSSVRITIDFRTSVPVVLVDGGNLCDSLTVDVCVPAGDYQGFRCAFRLAPGKSARVELKGSGLSLLINGVTASPLSLSREVFPQSSIELDGAAFLSPSLRPGLRALAAPPYRVITHGEIKRIPSEAAILVDAADSLGDDRGVFAEPQREPSYTYPAGPAFVQGSFDIRRMKVLADTICLYFDITLKTLSDPGWHPEYGFQLTMLAIGVDTGGAGRTQIGRNASYALPQATACERLVFVGGGVEVEEESGRVIAAYVPAPADREDPLGNAATGRITFALPLALFGRPRPGWTFTLVSGGQDDHGGGGLGEFRTVGRTRTDWSGGGKADNSGTNLYDILIATTR